MNLCSGLLFFLNVTASHLPIAHQFAAPLFHKVYGEFEKEHEELFSPGPQLKLSLAKWQLFIPHCPNGFFPPISPNKLQEHAVKERY